MLDGELEADGRGPVEERGFQRAMCEEVSTGREDISHPWSRCPRPAFVWRKWTEGSQT